MSARDVLATRVGKLMGWHGPLATSEADAFIAALTAAGYSIAPPGSRVVPAAIEWFDARNKCIAASIGDPEYRRKLNRLSEAEDALAAALRALAETKP